MADPQDFVDEIINNAIATANTATTDANNAASEIIALSQAHFFTRSEIPIAADITAIEPEIPLPINSEITYTAYRDELIAKLSDELAGFFATYYPLTNDAFDEATAKFVDIITNGGTGIPQEIEDQIWQRGRDRITSEGVSLESQVVEGFAAKAIQLPSGAMDFRLRETRYQKFSNLGKASTDIATTQAQIEIDMLKFAIAEAMKARFMAMNAAADYIRSIAIAPDVGLDLAKLNTDQRAQLMSATATLYRARLSRDEIVLRGDIANTNADLSSDQMFLDDQYKYIDEQVKGAAYAADVYKGVAQAALTALNTISSVAVTGVS